MANSKYITPEGKTKLLKLGFINKGDTSFQYLALGGEGSSASTSGDAKNFSEVGGSDYTRVQLKNESDNDINSQSITLSGIFESGNYRPSNGGVIEEIGIVDNSEKNSSSDTFFAFAQVPKISKTDNMSLKYTVVITIL